MSASGLVQANNPTALMDEAVSTQAPPKTTRALHRLQVDPLEGIWSATYALSLIQKADGPYILCLLEVARFGQLADSSILGMRASVVGCSEFYLAPNQHGSS